MGRTPEALNTPTFYKKFKLPFTDIHIIAEKERWTSFTVWRKILENTGIASKMRGIQRKGFADRLRFIGKDEEYIAKQVEYVWDHSLDVTGTVLKYWSISGLPDSDLSFALSQGLLHDVPEIIAGDITPYDEDERPDYTTWHRPSEKAFKCKRELERGAVVQVLRILPKEYQKEFQEVWSAYDEQNDPVSQFVKDCDIMTAYQRVKRMVKEDGLPQSFLLAFLQQANVEVRNQKLKDIIIAETTSVTRHQKDLKTVAKKS